MKFDAVAIAAAEGGLAALRKVVARLPADFPVPILCLQPGTVGRRPVEALRSLTEVEICWAEANEKPRPGCIYFAPPGTTLLVKPDGHLLLAPFGSESASMNPEDLFLRSVATAYGAGTLAIVLSGAARDATDGAQAVRKAGGKVIAHEKGPWLYRDAADAVIEAGLAEEVLPLEEISTALKLRTVASRLAESDEVRVELEPVLDAALEIERIRSGAIKLYDRVDERLRILVQRGYPPEFVRHFEPIDVDDVSTASTRALRERRRVFISDVERDPLYAPHRELARRAGYRAVQSTPLFVRGRHLVGVLSTNYPRTTELGEFHEKQLDELAAVAGDVLASHL